MSTKPGLSTAFTARPYRDFLTPSLHRRFTTAALLTLGVCYAEAVWMGQWDLFWQWFPLGLAGVRTFFIFISILAVYILRIAQLHIGARATASGFSTFLQYLFGSTLDILQTLLWYCVSAWIFGEVYIGSAATEAKLSVVDPGRFHERPRLNERPIYLRAMFLCLGVSQAFIHLYRDYDRVKFDIVVESVSLQQQQTVTATIGKLRERTIQVAKELPVRVLITTFFASLIYAVFLRHTAWRWTFMVAKSFHSLPKASRPTTYPISVADLLGRFVIEGALLLFLWEFANLSFDVLVAQEPLKKGSPLTDGSNDPNYSLLAGLKAKKGVTRNFAFWELAIVAQNFQSRRKAIFEEINRTNGSTWAQLVAICLGELHAVVKRIQDSQQPPSIQPKPQAPQQAPQVPLQTLPRLTAPLSQANIFTAAPAASTRLAALESSVGAFAKSHGQSPGNPDPVTPRARKLLTYGTDRLLSAQQQSQLSKDGLASSLRTYALAFLRSPVGGPFRHTFARRATAVVTGSPYSSLGPIVAAISATTRLAVASLKEDPYGKVHGDVPNIIRTFTSTCETVERFLAVLPVHWTDVEFEEGQRAVEEVEVVVRALRDGLRDLVNEFGEYADHLKLSQAEMRAAKEAVARGGQKVE